MPGVNDQVLPNSWLAERLERAFVAVTNLRGSLWWPGSMWGYEHVARWIRNVALHQPNHTALPETVEKLVGLVEAGKVFADYEKHGLAAYNEEEVVAGLLAHYRVFGDARVLAAARQLGASIAANHPRLAGNHYYKSLAIGPLCDLAEVTGDDAFLTAALAIAEDQQLALLRLPGTHGAAAGMIACWHVKLFERTGQRRYLDWALEIWEAIRQRQFVTGGLGEVLRFTAPPSESDLHDEACQHSWWLMANLALWRATDESRFLAQVERTFYNHFLFAQLHRGEDGGFCALGDVDQAFRGQHNYICCDNEAFFGFKEFVRHAVTATPDGVSVNFLLPVAGHVNGLGFRLETDYPVTGSATLHVTSAEPRELTLRFPQSNLKDQRRVWKPGDRVQIVLPMPMRVELDNNGAGARSVPVRFDGQEQPAKRVAVFHGPVVAVMFRTGHGNQLSWVWNGDYPEALESNGGDARDIEVSTIGGLALLRWHNGAVTVLPGLPVHLDWQGRGAIRYATAKRVKNHVYGDVAFPYPFPAVTTRDNLSAGNQFVAGGGSFSLAETLSDGGELKKTGTVRLSNGTFRTICHYDPAQVTRVIGRVAADWAGIELETDYGYRLIFPLAAQPLSQDLTRLECESVQQVQVTLTGTRLQLRGPVIEHTPVLLPKSLGLTAGTVVQDHRVAALLADYDADHLIARLPVPGDYVIQPAI